jgi:hypothetical protein
MDSKAEFIGGIFAGWYPSTWLHLAIEKEFTGLNLVKDLWTSCFFGRQVQFMHRLLNQYLKVIWITFSELLYKINKSNNHLFMQLAVFIFCFLIY